MMNRGVIKMMTEIQLAKKCYEIVKQLDDIIWWCGTIDNHIYDVDEEGVRHPRDIYQIRSGFAKRYNELKDELERGQIGGDNEFKYENN